MDYFHISHANDPNYPHFTWELRLNLPTLQHVYDVNKNIMQYNERALVFNIQDVVTPIPP
jgi:hypothetical protein